MKNKRIIDRVDDIIKWGVSLLVCLLFFVLVFCRFSLINFYDPDTGGIEYELIYEIQRLYNGNELYIDPAKPPFHINQKTPLYHLLISGLANVFLDKESLPFALFKLSRVVTFIFNIVALFLCFFFAKSIFKVQWAFASLVVAGVYFNMTAHFHSRMDSLYFLLFVSLVLYFFKNINHFSYRKITLLSLLSALLILTKQTGIFICLPIGLFLLFPLSWASIKKATLYGVLTLVSLALGLYSISSDGSALYDNLVMGIQNGTVFYFLKGVLSSETQVPLLIAGMILGMLLFRKKGKKALALGVFLVYYLFVGLLSCLKYGAGLNYLIEFKFLLFISFGYLFFTKKSVSFHYKLALYSFFTLILLTGTGKVKEYYNNLNAKGNYVNAFENYEEQKMVANYIMNDAQLRKGEFVYVDLGYLAEEGFLINFLSDHVILPTISVVQPTWESHPDNLDLSFLFEGINTGLIRFVIVRKDKQLAEITCLGKSFIKFSHRTDLGDFSIYEFDL